MEWPNESGPRILPPRQALENAVVLPEADELAIDGLTTEEWQDFEDAITRS